MDLVGSVDEPQDPRVRRQLSEDEVLRDAGRAERLHGMIDDP